MPASYTYRSVFAAAWHLLWRTPVFWGAGLLVAASIESTRLLLALQVSLYLSGLLVLLGLSLSICLAASGVAYLEQGDPGLSLRRAWRAGAPSVNRVWLVLFCLSWLGSVPILLGAALGLLALPLLPPGQPRDPGADRQDRLPVAQQQWLRGTSAGAIVIGILGNASEPPGAYCLRLGFPVGPLCVRPGAERGASRRGSCRRRSRR